MRFGIKVNRRGIGQYLCTQVPDDCDEPNDSKYIINLRDG